MKIHNALFIIMASSLVMSTAYAGGSQTDAVNIKIQNIGNSLSKYNYFISEQRPISINDMPNNGGALWDVEVDGRSNNVIIVACDDNCGKVEVDAYNMNGDLVVSSEMNNKKTNLDQQVIQISNASPYADSVAITIRMRECKTNSCMYGLAVAEKPL